MKSYKHITMDQPAQECLFGTTDGNSQEPEMGNLRAGVSGGNVV